MLTMHYRLSNSYHAGIPVFKLFVFIYFQIYIFFLSPVFYVLDPENDKGHVQADIGSLSVQFCVYIKSYLCFCVWEGNEF